MDIFFEGFIFRFQLPFRSGSLPDGRSDLLENSFLLEFLLNGEDPGLLTGVADGQVFEELLDAREHGAHNPILLLGLKEADGDDQVDVKDRLVVAVKMPLELVQIAPPKVNVGLAEEALDERLGKHDVGF